MMIEDRPYPHEIREVWWAAIGRSDLTSDEKNHIMDIVIYAQPPLSIATLTKASAVYEADIDACDNEKLIDKLKKSSAISHASPKHIGTNFPIFYALTHPKQLNQQSNALATQSRLFMSDFFKEVELTHLISRGNFYHHVLAARDIIKLVINANYPEKPQDTPFANYVLMAVKSDALYAQRTLQVKDKMDVFTMLVDGELSPGEKTRDYHGGGRSSEPKRLTKHDPWHDKHLSRLAKSPPPPRRLMREAPDMSNTTLDADPEAHAMGVRSAPDKKRKDLEEATEHITLQRTTPSSLTPRDDRMLTRRFTLAAPTTTLIANTDISRLTPEHVHAVLRLPLEALTHTFAALLLSTGIPARRLMQLVVSEHLQAVISDRRDERPHWCPDPGVLCYRLLDGPSVRHSNPASSWVQLRLPAAFATVLNEHATSQPAQRPFSGARGRLNQLLRRHFRKHPGILPTANRLSATSWLYRRPHAVDDVAATTLSGQFGLALSAPAAYRQLPRGEIQQLLNDTLEDVGVTERAAAARCDAGSACLPNQGSQMGSAVAQPPDAFVAIFEEIRDAMRTPKSEISRWYHGMPFPLHALVTLYQLVAAQELLAWQLSTGARPIGDSSENRMGDKMQWVHDKNSARGIESRVIPLLKETRDSLRSLHRWTILLTHLASQEGIVIHDQRTAVRDTPAWLHPSKQAQQLVLRDMTWSDVSSLALPGLPDWPINVARHSLASRLRQRVSDAEVDALLGHARHGRMLSSPRAEASIGEQPRLRRALQAWLRECGYRPLNWRCMPWHY